jgi:hypothetical protein
MRFASNKLECSKQALSLNILAWYDENDSNYIVTVYIDGDFLGLLKVRIDQEPL